MHLAPGNYTFTTAAPYVSSVTYQVEADGINTPLGKLVYYPADDEYRLGTTGVAVVGPGPNASFVATTPGSPAIAGTVTAAH